MEFSHKAANTSFRLLAAQLYRTKPMTMPLGLLLIATLAASCLSTIVLNSATAQPTDSQFGHCKGAINNDVKQGKEVFTRRFHCGRNH
jgi:hypothetical protein